jgi:hypothetical protein
VGEPIFAPLEAAVSKIPPLKTRFESVSQDVGLPLIGSLAWQDLRAGWGGDGPVSQVTIKLSVAVDHIFAWHCLATPPKAMLPAQAHLTLLRPALELAVQSRWLLDPSVDSATRIGRALWQRLDNLEWTRKVEDEAKNVPGSGPVEKMQALRDKAASSGVAPTQMVDTVSLLKRFPQQSPSYDVTAWWYTSGVLHGQAWAALLSENEVVRAGASMSTYRTSANEPVAAALTELALRHLGRAIEDLHEYLEPKPGR